MAARHSRGRTESQPATELSDKRRSATSGTASQKIATGKRAVSPALALRVARAAGATMDELLAGQGLSVQVCPHCDHSPDDFVDEETAS
jgi:hypothetical protein